MILRMPLGAIINSARGVSDSPLGGRVNFVLGILLVLPSLIGRGGGGGNRGIFPSQNI